MYTINFFDGVTGESEGFAELEAAKAAYMEAVREHAEKGLGEGGYIALEDEDGETMWGMDWRQVEDVRSYLTFESGNGSTYAETVADALGIDSVDALTTREQERLETYSMRPGYGYIYESDERDSEGNALYAVDMDEVERVYNAMNGVIC